MLNKNSLKFIAKSSTLALNELSHKKLAKGETVYLFGFGQSPLKPPSWMVNQLGQYAHHTIYPPSQGLKELMQILAKFYSTKNTTIIDEHVYIGPGSKSLIFNILASFKKASIILPAPCWVSYKAQAEILGHTHYFIETNIEHKWKITADQLSQFLQNNNFIAEQQKILILTNPGNPTGSVFTPAELQSLATICRKHNILVISDEIYSLLTYNRNHHSIIEYYPEFSIVTNGISKWCSLGGWRLGFCYHTKDFPKEFATTFNGLISESFSGVNTPIQFVTKDAYSDNVRIKKFVDIEIKILKQAAKLVTSTIQKNSKMKLLEPEGAFYIFIDFSEYAQKLASIGIKTSQDLCNDILDKTGVAILPGNAFGMRETYLTARLAFVDFCGNDAVKDVENLGKVSDSTFMKLNEGIVALCKYFNF